MWHVHAREGYLGVERPKCWYTLCDPVFVGSRLVLPGVGDGTGGVGH